MTKSNEFPSLDEKLKCGYSRCGGHNVTVVKWAVQLLRCDQTTRVSDIGHQVSTLLVANAPECCIIPVSRVGRSTADDQAGLEYLGLLVQGCVIDELRRRVKTIGERLEVDRRRSHFLFRSLQRICKPVRQVRGCLQHT